MNCEDYKRRSEGLEVELDNVSADSPAGIAISARAAIATAMFRLLRGDTPEDLDKARIECEDTAKELRRDSSGLQAFNFEVEADILQAMSDIARLKDSQEKLLDMSREACRAGSEYDKAILEANQGKPVAQSEDLTKLYQEWQILNSKALDELVLEGAFREYVEQWSFDFEPSEGKAS